MKVIYANKNDDLNVKMLGLHHDHCTHYYRGWCTTVPNKYSELVDVSKGTMCLIYDEDAV